MLPVVYFNEKRDRHGYELPPGPWMDEPDKAQWTDLVTGLPCLAVRGPMGAWCGYVGVTEGHPYFAVPPSEVDAYAHGSLNFGDFCHDGPESHAICHVPGPGEPDRVWWLGFDCMHAFDIAPAFLRLHEEIAQRDPHMRRLLDMTKADPLVREEYRTLRYVQAEVAYLARQLARPALTA